MNRDIYKKVDLDPNLARDMTSGAVVNINTKEIQRQKRLLEERRAEKQQLARLQSEMSDIKMLLQQLIEKNNNG